MNVRLGTRSRQLLAELLAVLFFVALAALTTRPLVADLSDRTLAGGDPFVDLWTVDWLSEHFFEPRQIFHGNIFVPAPHAVLYSDLSLGTVVLLLPLRLFARDPVPLYNLALLLAYAFGGWAFYRLALHHTGRRWAALLAGVLAGFGSHQTSHVYHLNLLTIGWLALLLLALFRIVERPRLGSVLLAGVSFSLSAQSSGYYGVAAVILALVFAAVHWRVLRQRRVLGALVAAAIVAGVLTAPYLIAYLGVHAEQGLRRPIGMSMSMAFQPGRDLTSHGYLYRAVLGSEGERLFPGLLVLVLGALGASQRVQAARCYLAAAFALLIVSLGPFLELGGLAVPLPYRWLIALPPFDGMRHPNTFAAVATFIGAVLAAMGFARLPIASRGWAGPVLVLLAVAETLSPEPVLQQVPRGLPPYYAALDGLPPGSILELPVFNEQTLLWAARHGGPMINGQGSAFVPVDTLRLDRFVENHWLKRAPEDLDASKPTPFLLARFPVRYVVLPTGREPGYWPLAEAFDRSRSFRLAAEASDGDRVYEVRNLPEGRLPGEIPSAAPRPPGPLADPGERGEDPGDVLRDQREPVGHEQ